MKSDLRAEGKSAYKAGKKLDDCPYPIGNSSRTDWIIGWLDADTATRLSHLFPPALDAEETP